MPTVLRKYGIRFHFYGSDMSESPYIHAEGHGGAAKVWLDRIEFAEHKGFKPSDLKRIVAVTAEHRERFLEAWHEFFRDIH